MVPGCRVSRSITKPKPCNLEAGIIIHSIPLSWVYRCGRGHTLEPYLIMKAPMLETPSEKFRVSKRLMGFLEGCRLWMPLCGP